MMERTVFIESSSSSEGSGSLSSNGESEDDNEDDVNVNGGMRGIINVEPSTSTSAAGRSRVWRAGRSIPQMMRSALEGEDTLKDVFFVFEEEEAIGAHKLILSIASPVFYQMFVRQQKFRRCKKVKLPEEYTSRAFRQLLQYIYCRSWTSTGNCEEVLELLRYANQFAFRELACSCRSEIRGALNASNAARFLQAAIDCGDERLKELAMERILDNPLEVFESREFLRLSREALGIILQSDLLGGASELEIFNAAIKWAESSIRSRMGPGEDVKIRGKDIRGELGAALYFIRFPLMEQRLLMTEVFPRFLLSNEEKLVVMLASAAGGSGGELLNQSLLQEEEEGTTPLPSMFSDKKRTKRRIGAAASGGGGGASGASSPRITTTGPPQQEGEEQRGELVDVGRMAETILRITGGGGENSNTNKRSVEEEEEGGANNKRVRMEEEEEEVPEYTTSLDIVDDEVPGPSSAANTADAISYNANKNTNAYVADWVGRIDFSGIQVPESSQINSKVTLEEEDTAAGAGDDVDESSSRSSHSNSVSAPRQRHRARPRPRQSTFNLLSALQEAYIRANASSSPDSVNLTNTFRKWQLISSEMETEIRDSILEIEETTAPVVIDGSASFLPSYPLHFPNLQRIRLAYLKEFKSAAAFKSYWKEGLDFYRLLLFTVHAENVVDLWGKLAEVEVTLDGVKVIKLKKEGGGEVVVNRLEAGIAEKILVGLAEGGGVKSVVLRGVEVDDLRNIPSGSLERLALLKVATKMSESAFMEYLGKCEALESLSLHNFGSGAVVFNLALLLEGAEEGVGLKRLRKLALRNGKLMLSKNKYELLFGGGGVVGGSNVEELTLDGCSVNEWAVLGLRRIFGKLKRVRFFKEIGGKLLGELLRLDSLERIVLWGIGGGGGTKKLLREIGLGGYSGSCIITKRRKNGGEEEGDEGNSNWKLERVDGRGEIEGVEWQVMRVGNVERIELWNKLDYEEFGFDEVYPNAQAYTLCS